jgi:predicted HicB family RNase H-like nuclease
MLKYKGYAGHAEYDDEAGIFHGEVLDLRDVITFQGKSVDEIEQAFRESIDDYLEFCEQRGEAPDKAFSGRLMLRLSPKLHRKVYVRALREGKSLNQGRREVFPSEPGYPP